MDGACCQAEEEESPSFLGLGNGEGSKVIHPAVLKWGPLELEAVSVEQCSWDIDGLQAAGAADGAGVDLHLDCVDSTRNVESEEELGPCLVGSLVSNIKVG